MSVDSSFKPLPNVVFTLQKMFPNVSQTQTFAGETNWREIRSLEQELETASDLKLFGHPRCVRVSLHVMKTLGAIASFDYLND